MWFICSKLKVSKQKFILFLQARIELQERERTAAFTLHYLQFFYFISGCKKSLPHSLNLNNDNALCASHVGGHLHSWWIFMNSACIQVVGKMFHTTVGKKLWLQLAAIYGGLGVLQFTVSELVPLLYRDLIFKSLIVLASQNQPLLMRKLINNTGFSIYLFFYQNSFLGSYEQSEI